MGKSINILLRPFFIRSYQVLPSRLFGKLSFHCLIYRMLSEGGGGFGYKKEKYLNIAAISVRKIRKIGHYDNECYSNISLACLWLLNKTNLHFSGVNLEKVVFKFNMIFNTCLFYDP